MPHVVSPKASLSRGQWTLRQAASSAGEEEEEAEEGEEAAEAEEEEAFLVGPLPDIDMPAALLSTSSMVLQAANSHSSSTAAKGL